MMAKDRNKILSHISIGKLKVWSEKKKYLDFVIKTKIFTYDDIYKRTFPNDKIFDELKELHKEYAKVYKKEKGKSP